MHIFVSSDNFNSMGKGSSQVKCKMQDTEPDLYFVIEKGLLANI